MTHDQLNARLDALAESPDLFEERARELAIEMDAKGIDLEISDPVTWRKSSSFAQPTKSTRSVEDQFREEVGRIIVLDRESEAQLARRIEFARIRLDLALEAEGLTDEDLERGGCGSSDGSEDAKAIPVAVCRRWTELHALRTELVERNLYLVLINVERYAHTRASRLDLIQEGAAVLFRAVDGFDWKRGLLFRTYAVHWLNQAFRSHLYNFGQTVRVPVYLQKAMKHVKDAIEKLGDPDASPEDIARESGLGEKLVASALRASRATYSVDFNLGDDDAGPSLRDTLTFEGDDDPYTPELEDISLSEGLTDAMNRLSAREQLVVSLRFGIGTDREHTLAEVAKVLGVSLERVRQIQVRALGKMDTPVLRRSIDPFL